MFDQLALNLTASTAHPEGTAVEGESPLGGFSPFDELDVSSVFFEQYLIQDVRQSADSTQILGGQLRLNAFLTRLAEENRSISHLRLRCVDPSRDAHRPEFGPDHDNDLFHNYQNLQFVDCLIPVVTELSDASGRSVIIDDDLHVEDRIDQKTNGQAMRDSDLVWIEVKLRDLDPEHQRQSAEAILQWLHREHSACSSGPLESPIRIVTTLSGRHVAVDPPFIVRGDEARTHVPLWIDHGNSHACRIQNLAGSFDLLPTVEDFLAGSDSSDQPTPDAVDESKTLLNESPGLTEIQNSPISLKPLCGNFPAFRDRLLRLVGDNWTALRTAHYLVIRANVPIDQDADVYGEPVDESQATTRHLYLKPDDVWNVHDVIVAYDAIADELEAIASQDTIA
jgi:hypothetical protein